ncbi:DUF2207 domain-containing protein [Intrasporangium sp.]|uniref:DUF2207 domain-containing protein n=1 Tax=Intrasporangium sp. TaxID=1925024 RepID=UPI003221A1D7
MSLTRTDRGPVADPVASRRPARVPALLALLLATAALVFTPAVAARAAGGEAMTSFRAVYDLQPDGSVRVAETIQWRFPSGEERHGIFRDIVVRMGVADRPDSYRYFEMTDVSVSSPTGAPAQFRVTPDGAADQIRIGSADEWTSGTQTYLVGYTLHNLLNPIAQNDIGQNDIAQNDIAQNDTVELHYNVFGGDEETQRDHASITVNAPAASTDVLCFRGETGSDTRCRAKAGEPTSFSADDLAPGEAMTVVARYPAAAFDDPRPDIREGDLDAGSAGAAAPAVNAAAWVAGIGAPVIAAAVMATLWWTRGRDEQYAGLAPGLTPAGVGDGSGTGTGGAPLTRRRRRQPVAVQFHPPPGVQPGMVGTLVDETANPIDVSATVIDLAVRGYLQIDEIRAEGIFTRTDWVLRRLDPPPGDHLLPYEGELLGGLFRQGASEVRLSELKNTFADTLKRIQSMLYREVVQRGWFHRSPQSQRAAWQALGIVLAVSGGLVLFYGRSLVAGLLGGGFTGGLVLGIGLVASGGIVLLVGRGMAARTPEGSAVLAQSLGFKEYLVTAEAGQIAFEEASNIFSRYLPFAVVFGVADRWARTFAEVARAAEAADQALVMPTWYVWSGGAFPDFTSIADGVAGFSTTSTGTFTSTPGSSGTSGFSSGGGFSGSGGGGSSSGSW